MCRFQFVTVCIDGGGRLGNRRAAFSAVGANVLPTRSDRYRRLNSPFEPLRVVFGRSVETLHESALNILERSGMRILHPGARRGLAEARAEVNETTEMVRFDRLVRSACQRSGYGMAAAALNANF